MASIKQLRLSEKALSQQQLLIGELNALVKDINRCEIIVTDLKKELEDAHLKHKDRNSTREEIDYLTDLLKVANKKLVWEKQMGSLQKRTPLILERLAKLVNDPNIPAEDPGRLAMLQALQQVQGAMERLQNVKVS